MIITAIYIFMLFVFLTYVPGVTLAYGFLPSISESYYRLPDKLKFIFTMFLWGFSFPAIMLGANFHSIYLPLAGGLLCMVGVATSFKVKLEGYIHAIVAIAAILLSQFSIGYEFHLYYVNILFVLYSLLVILFKVENRIFWLEIGAFLSISYLLGNLIYFM
jgi:hypothetical protein